jgi:hypothetical protein
LFDLEGKENVRYKHSRATKYFSGQLIHSFAIASAAYLWHHFFHHFAKILQALRARFPDRAPNRRLYFVVAQRFR